MFAGLVLVVLAAMSGCVKDAHVVKGRGESAVLEQKNDVSTGGIDVRGHVVNEGGRTAKDVVVYFKFFDAGTIFLEEQLLLGDISAGSSGNFSGTFFGPARVDPATFTWEYRIDWD